MIKRILITIILTGILIGIPCLFYNNYTQSSNRGQELNHEFKKIESEEIKRVHLTMRDDSDSMLLDSVIFDNAFCEKLRGMFLKLRDNSGAPSRLISRKTFYLDITTTSEKHIDVEVYVTDITALILVKTKSKDAVDGLGDVFSSTDMKELLESI